jgi:hypothetical protein
VRSQFPGFRSGVNMCPPPRREFAGRGAFIVEHKWGAQQLEAVGGVALAVVGMAQNTRSLDFARDDNS